MSNPDKCEAGSARGPLAGIRVIELADETAEYCGLLLMGLGAEVIKVEPPEGASTRRIGPFAGYRSDDLDASLHLWHYNSGKRSVVIETSLKASSFWPEGSAT